MRHILQCFAVIIFCHSLRAASFTSFFNNTHTYTNSTIASGVYAKSGVFTNGIVSGASTFTSSIALTNDFLPIQIGSGTPGYTISGDSVRISNYPVAILRPITPLTGMVLDLMPNGTNKGPVNIDLVNTDLRTQDTNNWNVARLGSDKDGAVTIGSAAWGTNTAKSVTIQGSSFFVHRITGTGAGTPVNAWIWGGSGNFTYSSLLFGNDNTDTLGSLSSKPKGITLGTDGVIGYADNDFSGNYNRHKLIQSPSGVLTLTVEGAGNGATGNSFVLTGDGSERFHAPAKFVNLTDATATTLFTIPVPATNYVGLTATVTVYATDGTDHQSKTSLITVDGINKSGTITPTITQVDNTTAASAGTLTCTYTATDNGSNVMAVKANANSSLAETVLRSKIVIVAINSNGSAAVTEQ